MNFFRGTFKSIQFGFIAALFFLGSGAAIPRAEESEGKSLCWRGQPLPKCKSFLITEFGISWRLVKSPKPSSSEVTDHLYGTWDLGWMKNISDKYAIGGTLYAGAGSGSGSDRGVLGIKARVRRWLKPDLGLDVAPGLLLMGTESNDRLPGFTGQVGICWGDWVSVFTQVEIIPYEQTVRLPPSYLPKREKKTEMAWYAGAKLGYRPGTVALVVVTVVAVLIAAYVAQLDIPWGN